MTGQHLKWPLRLLAFLIAAACFSTRRRGGESRCPTAALSGSAGNSPADVSGRFEVVADRISLRSQIRESRCVLENLALIACSVCSQTAVQPAMDH
jgi:hypothetical protein